MVRTQTIEILRLLWKYKHAETAHLVFRKTILTAKIAENFFL